MNIEMIPLHFLRPHFLWVLLLLPLAWLWLRRQRAQDDVWKDSIDAHLRPHVLEPAQAGRRRSAAWPLWWAAALAVLALAGPAWRQLPQPVWQNSHALVVALDLSSATAASDLPPSRLLQARAKLRQLLGARPDGQIGLIAFADDAHTVTPLTEDVANVGLFIDALSPDIMPVDGQNPARAIEQAVTLMQQAGAAQGDILLVTDHADDDARNAARKANAQGYRVSVIGLGSRAGADVRTRDGQVRRVRLDAASLQAMAAAGGGGYADIDAGTGDLQSLGVLDAQAGDGGAVRGKRGTAWQDEGYWLLLPLMLLSLWAFRRRAAPMLLVLAMLGSGMPHMAYAQSQSPTQSQSGSWWLRADQQQHRWMEQGHRAYRAGDYAKAAESYAQLPGAQAQYNLGNALAKAGRYDEAVAAYDRALAMDANLADARANRETVERARKRKPPPGERSQQNQSQPSQKNDGGKGSSQQKSSQPQQQQPPQQPPKPSQPGSGQPSPSPASPKPQDAEAERAAEQAQRERMQRELAAQQARAGKPAEKTQAKQAVESQAQREQREAVDGWLRRVPDTPGDWLKQKFWIEHLRRRAGEDR